MSKSNDEQFRVRIEDLERRLSAVTNEVHDRAVFSGLTDKVVSRHSDDITNLQNAGIGLNRRLLDIEQKKPWWRTFF
jgi:hypothetical protein